MVNQRFSVVMSVYRADDPAQFGAAFESVLDQSVVPDEIVVVVDGPIGAALRSAVDLVQEHPLVRVIDLPVNMGLGGARDLAVRASKHEVIAVMDADDISVHRRFEMQLGALESSGADVIGGYIEEFEDSNIGVRRVRKVPLLHDQVIAMGRWRQPVNHVTIMFKRQAYVRAGGYRPIRHVEDYDMFARMFVTDVKFRNIPEVLVHVRCGKELFGRRSGYHYLRAELALLHRMRRSGFLSLPVWIAGSGIRVVTRMVPRGIVGWIYRAFLREAA